MKNIRNERGITLVALAVTIVVLMILSVSLTASMTTTIEMTRYNKIKEDIIALTEDVKVYYTKNGTLPAYTDTPINLDTHNVPANDRNPNDSGVYYPIDISVLPEDLMLNCGQGNKDKDFSTDDLYVMDSESLTVYYLKGALLNNIRHYTIVDDFSGGSPASEYYSKVDLPIISVVTMESNGTNAKRACTGDTVTLRMLTNYTLTALPVVTINNEEVTVNWNGNIGTATYKLPFTEDLAVFDKEISFSISGYEADGRSGEEITSVNFGGAVYRYAETLLGAFKNGDLQVGDYVNYQNPVNGEYNSAASFEQKYTTNNNGTTVNWRVLGLSEDGNHLLLTSGSPLKTETYSPTYPCYRLKGATGMVKFKDELDNICGIYKNNYADSVKSLTIDDINRLCGVTVHIGTSADGSDSKVYKTSDETQTNIDKENNIGKKYSYTGQYASPEDYLNGTTSSFEKTSDSYCYLDSDAISSSSALYDVLFANTDTNYYWLASSAVRVYSDYCGFGPGMVRDGYADLYYDYLFGSDGHEREGFAGVRPVVTLKSNVKYGQIVKISPQTEEKWPGILL